MSRPWEVRQDWKVGRIGGRPSTTGRSLAFAGVMGVLLLGTTLLLGLVVAIGAPRLPLGVYALLAGVQCAGPLVLVAGAVSWLWARRFGPMTLKLNTLPVPIGGMLDAVIEVEGSLPARVSPQLSIRGDRIDRHRVDTRRFRTNVTMLHTERWSVPRADVEVNGRSIRIPVRCKIPGHVSPSVPSGNQRVVWTVTCTVGSRKEKYEVPVFHPA
jgi:hypothetical protein